MFKYQAEILDHSTEHSFLFFFVCDGMYVIENSLEIIRIGMIAESKQINCEAIHETSIRLKPARVL